MIAAFGGADEEGAALAVGERGAEDVAPGGGFEVGDFIENDEIEAFAAEGVGIESAFDDDGRTVEEVDAALGFVGLVGPLRLGDAFEATPEDACGEFVGRADIPDEAVGGIGSGFEDFGEGEFGFTETAAGDEDAETFFGTEDFPLARVEAQFYGGRCGVGGEGLVGHGVFDVCV